MQKLRWLTCCIALAACMSSIRAGGPSPSKPILITGIVENQWDRQIVDNLMIDIYSGHRCLARTRIQDGMFKVDLTGQVDEDASITVLLRGQRIHRGKYRFGNRFIFSKYTTYAGHCQNIVMPTKMCYQSRWKIFRWIFPHRRHGHRTLYINEI
jgi:hypothetical protein